MKIFLPGILLLISTLSVAQSPLGFFLDDAQPRSAVLPTYVEYNKPTSNADVTITANYNTTIAPVSPWIYGNNANIFMTQMVTQPSLLQYIRDLSPRVLRFPGGNLSSIFFWDAQKGLPPADAPAKLVDSNGAEIDPGYWYGKNEENWTLSLDNYYKMLEQTGTTGIITVNYGYARYSTAEDPVASAAHHAAEWVRYDNGRTKFWEIGNESNGTWQAGFRIKTADNKDGQPEIITGELYGKHYKVFVDSMYKAAEEVGATIYIGAQLLAEVPATWWNQTDKNWNSGVFQQAGTLPDYYIIHSYYTPYATNSNAADILNTGVTVTTDMMEYVTESVAAAGLPPKPLALTEWNIFAEGSKQQVSNVSGMHAAIVLGELIKNNYGFATRWDLANGWGNGNDHGMFSQGNEPGVPLWNPRPSFYYMYFFQRYTGDTLVATTVNGSDHVLAYASQFSSGESGFVIVNKGTSSHTAEVKVVNRGVGDRYYFHSLRGGSDNGEFSLKVYVNDFGTTYSAGGPSNYKTIKANSAFVNGGIRMTLPPRSVTYLLTDKGDQLITSVNDEEKELVYVYPNPVKEKITIETPINGNVKVEITDSQGKKVYCKEVYLDQKKLTIQNEFVPGLYFIRIYFQNKMMVKKVVVDLNTK